MFTIIQILYALIEEISTLYFSLKYSIISSIILLVDIISQDLNLLDIGLIGQLKKDHFKYLLYKLKKAKTL